LEPKAAIAGVGRHFRVVPEGDIIRLPGWSHRMYFNGNTHAREAYP
jgi:hypothetical protein